MNHLMLLAAGTADAGGFSVGTLLMYVGGAILLAFFCSLGFIARIREHRLEQRRALIARQRSAAGSDAADVAHQLTDAESDDHGQSAADEDAHHGPRSA